MSTPVVGIKNTGAKGIAELIEKLGLPVSLESVCTEYLYYKNVKSPQIAQAYV